MKRSGGSCQIGISYDPDDLKNGVVVIASFIGGSVVALSREKLHCSPDAADVQ